MPENNINFQPMPKRFMVWDERLNDFVKISHTTDIRIFDILGLKDFLRDRWAINEDLGIKLVQSTNLFAKGGKEIFEGSLLQTDKEGVGYVYMEDNGQWNVLFESSVHSLWDLLYAPSCKLVGHILSNPELLEEQ